MSTYVMSDLHGEAGLFRRMLEKIRFSGEDTLYILGDVIDRGPDGIGLLLEIMERPNMVLLLGNHEHMLLRYFAPDAEETDILRWNKNGNRPTLEGWGRLDDPRREALTGYLSSLPVRLEITAGGRDYYLVHGFPGATVRDQVWGRPGIDDANPVPGRVLIIGHTPVISLLVPPEEREQRIAEGWRPGILHAPGFIDIDCGCSWPDPAKTLGCLRLEDMAEFYVRNEDTL